MSQNPLVDRSSAQSSKTSGLKPALATALASLEVQLDQELARYRRTRTVYRTSSQPGIGNSTSSKLQQLTVFSTKLGKKPTAEDTLRSHLQKFGAATTNTPASTALQTEDLPIPNKTNTPSASPPQAHEEMPRTKERSEPQNLKMPSTSVEAKTQTTRASTSTSIVPAGIDDRKSENPTQPDDFLESSEALLRSLNEEQPNTQRRTNSSDSLLSPLGIGSILLLLLASLSLGFIVFNPKNLSHFSLDGFLKQNAPQENAENAENTVAEGNNTKTALQPQLIPKYPNLAESEFPEVRDPNDVVGLKPKPKPIPKASPSPVATHNPINPGTTAQHLQPVVPPINSPPLSTATTPNLSSQKPDAELKPSKDGLYHIVTENQGHQVFASARKVVPDAYLSTSGKLIYLGAVEDKQKAQQLLQKLQANGIKARIQQP
ncbi:MAG: hypothetical protein DSM106950_28940 [Stigonema ocellatum SAG 48.90 = DSM 106950]|nr:hypothetical protein [Stigonema ocellatum SAG 48.90 = DSM 106950]